MRTIIAICMATMMSSSFADTTLVFADDKGANTVQIKEGILRAGGRNDGHDYLLFDSKRRTITDIDRRNKKYTRIDETSMKQMGGMITDMQRQMEEQLKNLPPDQQAQMRQMMAGLMPPGMDEAKQPVRNEPTSQTGKIGEWTCKIINIFKGDEKVSQVCATDYKSLDIPEQDYLTMKEFMSFVANISENFPMADQVSFASADLGDGMLPVFVEMLQKSTKDRSMTLNKINTETLERSLFTVPVGYTEQKVMQKKPQS